MKKSKLIILFLLFISLSGYSQRRISGRVLNNSGEAIPGVSVVVKNTTFGAVTDSNGEYVIGVPENAEVLVFSFIGMETREEEIAGRTVIDVRMTEVITELDEIVAVGYGSQRKRDITGSVVSVKSDIVENRPVLSVADALTGKVSGVNVTSVDGEPGTRQKINIRGATSITSDSEPLYIIDGFPSEVNNVSPADIFSIDILKDAASTAIYGSRGANGVIIITTKKGAAGRTKMNFYALTGIQERSKKLNLLQAYDFAKKNDLYGFFYIDANEFNLANYDPEAYSFFQDEEDNYYLVNNENQYRNPLYYEPGATNTDWQDAMFRTARFSDYRFDVSGGEAKYTYSVSFGYKNQEGILLNTNYEEYSGRINLEYDLTDRVKLNINSSAGRDNISGYADASDGVSGVLYYTLLQPPVKPVDFTKDFVLEGESVIGQTINPVLMANIIENDKRSFNSLSNAALHISLPKGFGVHITGGYYYAGLRHSQYFPSDVSRGASVNGRSVRMNQTIERLNNENLVTYDKSIGDFHKLQAMVGNSVEKGTVGNVFSPNTNFSKEGLGYYGHGYGLTPLIPTALHIENTLASFFGRLNYSYKDKYLFKATMRADGSSRFARNNKWGYFPSAALGYRISEENFLRESNFVHNLKIRASWGISGKQAIESYQSLASIGVTTFSIDGTSASLASFPQRLESPNLKWETTDEVNLGIDLGIFSNQALNVTFDWYKRTTKDLLYREPIPTYTGYSVGLRNIGTIENSGYELGIQTSPVRGDFSWDINFNIFHNKTIVVEFGQQGTALINAGGISGNAHGFLEEGKRIGNWYGYQTNGIWQSNAEIQQARADGLIASSEKILPGYRKVVDQNDDGAITADDRVIIGNGQPDFTGGFTNSFSYKNFSLSFLLNFSYGNEVYNYTRYRLEEGINYDNQLNVDRWAPTLFNWDPVTQTKGDLYMAGSKNNSVPVAMFGKPQDNTFLDVYVEDASFLRLSDISLTYNLPAAWLQPLRLSNAGIFVSGRNLAVLTKYKGFDPDVNNSRNEASYLLPGLDNFAYPKAKMITTGIKLTF